jgi:tetratricopeptide (TPR) repeat protein/DNA-binding CsgD family transcriptional regulator
MNSRLPVLIFTFYFLLLSWVDVRAQYRLLTNASPAKRLQHFWQYCSENLISDKDSAATCQWLISVEQEADRLHDEQLKKYAAYFRLCFRVLFSANYEQYFAKGDYESVANVYRKAQQWARQNDHRDIEAVCEHYVGEVYYYAAKYSPAFEYLLRADDMFRDIGYQKIPAISTYLYDLALNYYKFEEWDKALHYFLEATHHPFYVQWAELSTFNSIGLIYNEKHNWEKAKLYYRQTLTKATQYKNTTWVGIVLDNLGELFAAQGQNDSALVYYVRSFHINEVSVAPENGALTALSIAQLQIAQRHPDSAVWYIRRGQELAAISRMDSATHLQFGAELMKVMVALNKQREDYKTALLYADSLDKMKYRLYQLLDDKIVNEVEAKRHIAEINLLETEKQLSHFRLYLFISSFLLATFVALFLFNQYRLRKRRQIADTAREKEQVQLEKQRVEEQLKQAEQALTAYLDTIKDKTDLIENLATEIKRLQQSANTTNTDLQGLTSNMEKLVSTTILTDEGWSYFRGLFEQVHPGFIHQLRMKHNDLSPAETRMLMLTKLNLQSREIAQMLGISIESLRKARYRLRKRLNLEEETSFETFVQQI